MAYMGCPPQRFVTNYDNGLSLTEDSLFAKTGKWMQLLLAYNLKYVLNTHLLLLHGLVLLEGGLQVLSERG